MNSMLEAIYYEPLFLLFTLLLSIVATGKYKAKNNNITIYVTIIIISIFLSLFIGFRPLNSIFADMWNYYYAWGREIYSGFNWSDSNYIFDNIYKGMAASGISVNSFFILMASVYFIVAGLACIKLFRKNALIAYAVFLGAFSTFSYGVNGIKAGAASSIFLLALAYWENKKFAALLLFLSLGFHHSMIMPVCAYVVSLLYKNDKHYLYIWIICLIVSATHFTSIMGFLGEFLANKDEHGASYLLTEGDAAYITGFRLDFILYSSAPVLLGYISIFKRGFINNTYSFIWRTYLLTNSVWLLCMYASYTNRIAYLSWGFYPFVLLYPFVHENSSMNIKSNLNKIVYLHFLFTVFMNLIYKYIR